MLTPTLPLADPEIAANAGLITGAVLAHPIAIHLSPSAIAVLSAIVERDPPAATAVERRLLRRAVAVIDAAEIAISRRTPA